MIIKGPPCAIWAQDQETGEPILSIEPGQSLDTKTGLITSVDFAVRLNAVGRATLVEMINAGPPPFGDLEKL